ncbi:hypothetical protein M0805_005443 [Coniferiporia weirii]|nr:hypothetical protein M0805_005443 [Coniferiporia weirii]
MSSPPATPTDIRAELLSAAEQRARHDATVDVKYLARIHELKQSFRRLIDPGIVRPNNKEDTVSSLKTLETLSSNLLREPDNPKFLQFKPTNNTIKRRLVDVKGALEYAVAVEQFQPSYVFDNRHLEDLRIGNDILKEALSREAEKLERAQHSKLTQKELSEIARRNVQLNFEDDRKAKLLRDQQEANLRAARAAAGISAPAASRSSPAGLETLRGGVTLSGQIVPDVEPDVENSLTHRSSYGSDSDE